MKNKRVLEERASYPGAYAITSVDLNAEANHKRLMAGSLGNIIVNDKSKPMAISNFI